MEWWILSGLAAAILVIGVLSRWRKSHPRPESDKNIYPLW